MGTLSSAEWFVYAAAIVVLLAAASIVSSSLRNGITPMPSSAPVRRAVAAELRRLGSARRVVEAGSGWGTLAISIVRHCPGTRLTGIENSPVPLWISRVLTKLLWWSLPLQAERSSSSAIAFIKGDIYTYAYKDADVVVCYLYPRAMQRMSGILRDQLRPGSYVVSIFFVMPGWKPVRTVRCKDWYRTPVYVYQV
jgi:hypothetical protein